MKNLTRAAAFGALCCLAWGTAAIAADDQDRDAGAGQQTMGQTTPIQAGPELIQQVQQSLKDAGHDAGPVDGVWGEQTRQALREYQEAKDIEPTGELTVQTLSEMGIESSDFAAGEFEEQQDREQNRADQDKDQDRDQ